MAKAVGGEFYFNLKDIHKNYGSLEQYTQQHSEYNNHGYFLGGSYAIKWILRDLKEKLGQFNLLLPSYLCQSVITAIESEDVSFDFFAMDTDLNPDLDDLSEKLSKPNTVLYLINYFGLGQSVETLDYIKELRSSQSTMIIEDDVQSCFSKKESYGDYHFNSFKKWHAVDGSVVFTNSAIPQLEPNNFDYLKLRSAVRTYRYLQQESGLPFEQEYLDAVDASNQVYLKNDLLGMHAHDQQRFNQIDLEELKCVRQDNFARLLEHFADIALIKTLPEGIVPFCFPVVLDRRNEKRIALFDKQIFCPVHWNTPAIIKDRFPASKKLSEHILSIPINKTLTSQNIEDLTKILSA